MVSKKENHKDRHKTLKVIFNPLPDTQFIYVSQQKYPQYTLEVQAADMRGHGLTGRAKVVLNVTKNDESVPVIDQISVSTPPT